MTLLELKHHVDTLLKLYPEYKDAQLVYSVDEEGNGFNPVSYSPSIGFYDGNYFTEAETSTGVNGEKAVCIN
jgi:hypothetical protein